MSGLKSNTEEEDSPTKIKRALTVEEKEKADAAAEWLIHSVNAVTELLKANTELRDNMEKQNRSVEQKDAELFQLHFEN